VTNFYMGVARRPRRRGVPAEQFPRAEGLE
jgi:hypothetical protein